MKKIIKYTALIMTAITCLSLLCSCSSSSSRKIPAGRLALKEVGTVGEYSVLYEEYYFLANTYLNSIKDSFEGTDDELRAHVEKLVAENIITNHAILTLCEAEGVEYKKSEINDSVQKSIDDMVDGDRDAYIATLEEGYMTDHYVRFVTKVDLIYSQLPLKLAENGKISANEEVVFDYIKENFVRTWHIMIPNENAESLENAQNALADLKNNNTSMYQLIGSSLNKDVFMPKDGYCFAKGSMEKEYEDAAFGLEVGEYSEVISAKGEKDGKFLDCYYIMQRRDIDDKYISENYDTLYSEYSNSIVYQELLKTKESLEFVPNDYAKELDILSLEKPEPGFDWLPVIIIGICVIVIGAITLTVILITKKKKKKKSNSLIKKK